MDKIADEDKRVLSNDGMSFKCCACDKWLPISFRDQHHEIPQAAGGTDKDLVWLDNGCHQTAHKLAYAMMNPKRKVEFEHMMESFTDPHHKAKMFFLAKTVVYEMQLKNEGGKDVSGVLKPIPISVSQTMHRDITFAAKDKKLSLANYVIFCVKEQLKREN